MPPRGVKSSKRERQYEHIKSSAKKRGASTGRAKEIAARTVNKQRREAGETRSSGGRKTSQSKRSSASTGKGRTSSARTPSRSTKRATKKR
jgi:hypothetical protein